MQAAAQAGAGVEAGRRCEARWAEAGGVRLSGAAACASGTSGTSGMGGMGGHGGAGGVHFRAEREAAARAGRLCTPAQHARGGSDDAEAGQSRDAQAGAHDGLPRPTQDGGAARPRFGRRASAEALGAAAAAAEEEEEEVCTSRMQPSRGMGRRGGAALGTITNDATGPSRAASRGGGEASKPPRGMEWPSAELGASQEVPLAAAAASARRDAVRERRELADEARRQALLQKQQLKMQQQQQQQQPGEEELAWPQSHEELPPARHDAVRQRREQAEAARLQALLQKQQLKTQLSQARLPDVGGIDEGWDAQVEYENVRREAARQRREQAEEARLQALLHKQQLKQQQQQHSNSRPASAAEHQPPAGYGGQASWDPDADAARRDAVRQRREQAEAARRQALLQKTASGGATDPNAELLRLQANLEALPGGAQYNASRTGLRKQIATIQAAQTRETRRREQAQREAQWEGKREEQEAQRVANAHSR